MAKFPTDEQIDKLEKEMWVSTGVEEWGQKEELFNYREFVREALNRWGTTELIVLKDKGIMNQILQGWYKVLKDYRHWKMILKYPYCAFDTCVFFGNLGHPPNSLVDYYVAGIKQLDGVIK